MAEFVGQNPRSLALFLNEKKSAIQFINNPQKGTIFGTLENGEFVAISENAQQSIKTNGLGEITDYQVCDMPSNDGGGTFPLITLRGQGNIVGGFSF